jgi:general secretion pathway protein G
MAASFWTQSRFKPSFATSTSALCLLALAILSQGGCFPAFSGRTYAKVAAAKSDLETLSSALQNFRLDCGRYPTTKEGLRALNRVPKGLELKWKGPYLTEPIAIDPWDNAFHYASPDPSRGPGSYQLLSYGSDGIPGGEGDAAEKLVKSAQYTNRPSALTWRSLTKLSSNFRPDVSTLSETNALRVRLATS